MIPELKNKTAPCHMMYIIQDVIIIIIIMLFLIDDIR